jgi:hypothetical protein
MDCGVFSIQSSISVDKVIEDLTVYYNELKDNPQQIQKTNKTNEINPCLDV